VNITATLFGQVLTFGVLVWFVMQFLWEPLTKMMDARSKKIADGLAAGERGRHELQLAEQRATERLREAKQQAADIIAQANKRSAEIVEEAKELARQEGNRQLEAAKTEIEQEGNRAREQLREKVIELTLAATEKILEKEINAKSHADLVAKLVEKL
jgi:F-type H+-transporting ATPase subunit b